MLADMVCSSLMTVQPKARKEASTSYAEHLGPIVRRASSLNLLHQPMCRSVLVRSVQSHLPLIARMLIRSGLSWSDETDGSTLYWVLHQNRRAICEIPDVIRSVWNDPLWKPWPVKDDGKFRLADSVKKVLITNALLEAQTRQDDQILAHLELLENSSS